MDKDKYIDLLVYLSPEWKSYSSGRKGNYFADVPLFKALSKFADIRMLCINQPFTPVETTIKKSAKALSWMKGNRLERLGDNLFLYTPFAFVHEMVAPYSTALQKLNRAVLSKQILKQLDNLGFNSHARMSWVYHPLQYSYLGLANERFKIYKCWDLFRSREYPKIVREIIPTYEAKLINDSDIIFTPCTNLHKELSASNGNTFFIPAGVDLRETRSVTNGKSSPPEDLVDLKRPLIGFAGIITRRVDISLLRFLAESRPDWSIVLLGNIGEAGELLQDEDFCMIQKLSNVRFLGFKEFEILPEYLKHFDVCILPHSDIEVMRYAHPYKTLQYLACGKPVVSTDFPDAHYYKEVIRIAGNHKEFVDMVDEALKDTGDDSVRQRISFAERNTWDTRARETYGVLRNLARTAW